MGQYFKGRIYNLSTIFPGGNSLSRGCWHVLICLGTTQIWASSLGTPTVIFVPLVKIVVIFNTSYKTVNKSAGEWMGAFGL